MKTKSLLASKTFWINLISFFILWFTTQDAAATLIGGAIVYVLNLLLNMISNNTPINPVVDLTQYGISMKFLIYFINGVGLVVSIVQYFAEHAPNWHPAVWVTMVISFLTMLIRALTQQKKTGGV